MFETLARTPGTTKDDLVRELMGVVRGEAWKLFSKAPRALEFDELEAAGLLGLATASAQWEGYCERNGYDPAALHYFGAYALRRFRGAMLDTLRSADHCTRSTRTRAKALYAVGDGLGASDEELAAATGMSLAEVRSTRAAVAARPVTLDDVDYDFGYSSLADPSASVESAAAANEILGSATAVLDALPAEALAVVCLTYYHQLTDKQAGDVLGLPESVVAEVRKQAVLDVHAAMTAAATGGRPAKFTQDQMSAKYAPLLETPSGWQPVRWVSDSDGCRGTDSQTTESISGKECATCGTWHPIDAYAWWNRSKGRRCPYCPGCYSARQQAAHQRRRQREMAA
ncbi:MAG: hypothetical protein JO345_34550 [Streptosporangiaceae bacterium]|nr:hypothetical protein [Streptosporangiaceae bacterium]